MILITAIVSLASLCQCLAGEPKLNHRQPSRTTNSGAKASCSFLRNVTSLVCGNEQAQGVVDVLIVKHNSDGDATDEKVLVDLRQQGVYAAMKKATPVGIGCLRKLALFNDSRHYHPSFENFHPALSQFVSMLNALHFSSSCSTFNNPPWVFLVQQGLSLQYLPTKVSFSSVLETVIEAHPRASVIWLDNRAGPYSATKAGTCCTTAMLFRKSFLPMLRHHLELDPNYGANSILRSHSMVQGIDFDQMLFQAMVRRFPGQSARVPLFTTADGNSGDRGRPAADSSPFVSLQNVKTWPLWLQRSSMPSSSSSSSSSPHAPSDRDAPMDPLKPFVVSAKQAAADAALSSLDWGKSAEGDPGVRSERPRHLHAQCSLRRASEVEAAIESAFPGDPAAQRNSLAKRNQLHAARRCFNGPNSRASAEAMRLHGVDPDKFRYPTFDEHLAAHTTFARFRDVASVCNGKHCGPWVEDFWIDTFEPVQRALLSKREVYERFVGSRQKSRRSRRSGGGSPLVFFSLFGPFVPLFVQWLPITAANQTSAHTAKVYAERWGTAPRDPPPLSKLMHVLESTIQKHLVYVTVTEFDNSFGENISRRFPNILVLGASAGHVPIPLFTGPRQPPLPRAPTSESRRAVAAFAGSQQPRTLRPALMQALGDAMGAHELDVFKTPPTQDWRNRLAESSFALAPRGIGRGSFRLTEVLQLGMPAVYVYNNVNWLPYSRVLSLPFGPVVAMPFTRPRVSPEVAKLLFPSSSSSSSTSSSHPEEGEEEGEGKRVAGAQNGITASSSSLAEAEEEKRKKQEFLDRLAQVSRLRHVKRLAELMRSFDDRGLQKLHERALKLAETHFSQCALMRHIQGFLAFGGEGGGASDLECIFSQPEF